MLRVNASITKATCLGVIGLGTMGYGAAISARRRSFPTVGLDISPANIKRFTDTGGKIASDISALARSVGVLKVTEIVFCYFDVGCI